MPATLAASIPGRRITTRSTGFTAQYNQTYGVHWDTDNVNITGSGIVGSQNLLSGMFAEIDPGPITLTGSYVCNQSSPLVGAGFAIRNSENISFTNGVLYNNNASQMSVIGTPGGITITDWQTGQQFTLVTQNLTNKNNVIEGIGSTQTLFNDRSMLGGTDWLTFIAGFVSSDNTWWNASNSTTEFVCPSQWTRTLVISRLADDHGAGSGLQIRNAQRQSSNWVCGDGRCQRLLAYRGRGQRDFESRRAGNFRSHGFASARFQRTVKFTFDGISEVARAVGGKVRRPITGGSGTNTLTVSSTTRPRWEPIP